MQPVQPVQPAATLTGGIRAYAKYRRARGLPGGNHESVRRAIASERLERSVRIVDGATRIDFALADREWADNTDLSKAPDHVKIQAFSRPGCSGTHRQDPPLYPNDDPVSIEDISVMEVDEGLLCVLNRTALNENEGLLLDLHAAGWLADELRRHVDRHEGAKDVGDAGTT